MGLLKMLKSMFGMDGDEHNSDEESEGMDTEEMVHKDHDEDHEHEEEHDHSHEEDGENEEETEEHSEHDHDHEGGHEHDHEDGPGDPSEVTPSGGAGFEEDEMPEGTGMFGTDDEE